MSYDGEMGPDEVAREAIDRYRSIGNVGGLLDEWQVSFLEGFIRMDADPRNLTTLQSAAFDIILEVMYECEALDHAMNKND